MSWIDDMSRRVAAAAVKKQQPLNAAEKREFQFAFDYAMEATTLPPAIENYIERIGMLTPIEARQFIEWYNNRPLDSDETRIYKNLINREDEILGDGVTIPKNILTIFNTRNPTPAQVRETIKWSETALSYNLMGY